MNPSSTHLSIKSQPRVTLARAVHTRALAWLLLLGTALPGATQAETTSFSGATALYPAGSGVYTATAVVVITAPGTYYFTRDVIYSGPSYNSAISVQADNVTIDLNGHTLSSCAAGQAVDPAVNAAGIGVYGFSNMTVKNGTVSGFVFGVVCNHSGDPGHRVEDMRFNNNTCVGVYTNGFGGLVRRCIVNSTGGTSLPGYGDCHGIYVAGTANRVIDCDVSGVTASASNGGSAEGIRFVNVSDGVALNNRISQAAVGLRFIAPCTVKYRDTLFGASVGTPVLGGSLDAGGNF